MEESDFIFDDEFENTSEGSELRGDFSEGDKVLVNGNNFIITEFVKAKQVGDNLGFPGIYSWYKAKDPEDKEVNLFFYDTDIDCLEYNDQVAEKWWNDYKPTV